MFRTEIEEKTSSIQIDYSNQVISIGSCFAEKIGNRLLDGKLLVTLNPLGISYNPISIFELMRRAALQDTDLSDFFCQRDGLFYNFKLHSNFRFHSKRTFENKSNAAFSLLGESFRSSSILIITFGTAWIYERSTDNEPVSNCHKSPSSEFNRRLLGIDEIISAFFETKEYIEKINPEIQFLLTVSPVRHTKDSLEGNSVSKSVLRTACHYLTEMANNVHYYPSYEIMIDDLRDYRFYQSDLIHPNEQGIDYIWAHFRKTYFSHNTNKVYEKWIKIRKALAHKPFNPGSSSHREFLLKTLKNLEQLDGEIDLKDEIKKLQKLLT